jgi:hypothetical protein
LGGNAASTPVVKLKLCDTHTARSLKHIRRAAGCALVTLDSPKQRKPACPSTSITTPQPLSSLRLPAKLAHPHRKRGANQLHFRPDLEAANQNGVKAQTQYSSMTCAHNQHQRDAHRRRPAERRGGVAYQMKQEVPASRSNLQHGLNVVQ